ncbi:hypothetical protein LAC81_10200 [Ensifer adhaerens]|uniref:hypothetical protein n=1 Tax=Ensifer adhaerens TaxID=106592 RepID=UPI002E287436|nr:hypothetical protein [Ensifer adhaerens]UAX94538.1 hypothetical protein LAC78_10195 [Ensifer adhaerens]UAY02172.1 hypothetical protein LAC80_10205 [Ensifer adhaerens]UAY09555.1 hypothetical protein LAC81_10200 [Ensifer adhaerens]
MRITAIVEALVQCGASPEMILCAVRAAEAGQQSELERRRAGDRERQQRRRARVTSRDVTATGAGVLSDKESSPAPPKETNSPDTTPAGSDAQLDLHLGEADAGPSAQRGRRASRLPAAFEPDWDFAAGLGFEPAEASVEFDKFRDYWSAKAGRNATKLDWAATWRNWMRNAGRPQGAGVSRVAGRLKVGQMDDAGPPRRGHRQQAPPYETAFARHQRECRQAIENELKGTRDNDVSGNDDFAGAGPAFDLEPGDYRAH